MNTEIKSKHGIVRLSPAELYMRFVDLRNFSGNLPEGVNAELTADYDTLHAVMQGMDIGVRVTERKPYSQIVLSDDGAPFKFEARFNFEPADGGWTDFSVELSAELNMMMKMMLKPRLQEAMDKIVDTLAGTQV